MSYFVCLHDCTTPKTLVLAHRCSLRGHEKYPCVGHSGFDWRPRDWLTHEKKTNFSASVEASSSQNAASVEARSKNSGASGEIGASEHVDPSDRSAAQGRSMWCSSTAGAGSLCSRRDREGSLCTGMALFYWRRTADGQRRHTEPVAAHGSRRLNGCVRRLGPCVGHPAGDPNRRTGRGRRHANGSREGTLGPCAGIDRDRAGRVSL